MIHCTVSGPQTYRSSLRSEPGRRRGDVLIIYSQPKSRRPILILVLQKPELTRYELKRWPAAFVHCLHT